MFSALLLRQKRFDIINSVEKEQTVHRIENVGKLRWHGNAHLKYRIGWQKEGSAMTAPDLTAYAQAAILIQDGRVTAMNEMARHYLPDVEECCAAPDYLDLSADREEGDGIFCARDNCYTVRHTRTEQGDLFLFSPQPDMGLTRYQLDSALFQMRQFMGEFLLQIGPYSRENAPALSKQTSQQFSRSYHRMLRLMDNMEYVNSTQEEVMKRLDVVELWGNLTDEAETLLRENKTSVTFECKWPYLLVEGNKDLLSHLLLELLSNAGRDAKEGSIHINVEKRASNVILTVKDTTKDGVPNRRRVYHPRGAVGAIPLPDSGAGLGRAVAERIVRVHGGSMFSYQDDASTLVVVSLRHAGGSPYIRVETPKLERNGGFNPLMIGLSDILPSHLFGMEDLD